MGAGACPTRTQRASARRSSAADNLPSHPSASADEILESADEVLDASPPDTTPPSDRKRRMERYAALIGCAQNDASTQADIAAPGCDASTATDDSGSSSAETEAAERSTEPDAEKVRLLEQLQEQGRTLAAERASHAESQAQLATIERQWQERIEAAEAAGREVTREAARQSHITYVHVHAHVTCACTCACS